MRFHVLGLPHTVSSKDYCACAFTSKVVKFCTMMKDFGHHIIHYGHEDSDTDANENVSVLTNKDLEIAYGNYDWRTNFFKFDMKDHAYQTFYKNAIKEVGFRKQKHDFILPFWGSGVRPICDAHPDLIVVEPGIGYPGGHWAPYKIFESYAIYHAYGGLLGVQNCTRQFYDVIIPNYFDLADFEYKAEKDDYFLYLGRVFDGKGVHIASQVTKAIGARLIVAGQIEKDYKLEDHVEFVGYADVETRKTLMSNAKASFLPSMYIEPFGGVQIENLLSGTPTITTDWGAFPENNINGLTGYRCRTFNDFCWAARNIDNIKPSDCRAYGENFSLEKIGYMYEDFFHNVMDVHTRKGWYEEYPSKPSFFSQEKYGRPSLGDIFAKYKTNKSFRDHRSLHFKYEELFKDIRDDELRMFVVISDHVAQPEQELKAWREYFPNATVIGSNALDWCEGESLKAVFKDVGEFDIIIHDGLVVDEYKQRLFDVAFKNVKLGGFYIIETKTDLSHVDAEIWSGENELNKDNYLTIVKKKIPLESLR